MKYTTLTNFQLFIFAIITGLITSGIILMYNMYIAQSALPEVIQDASGTCIKVLNYENGHAFSCPDKDVLLRRYRVTISK